MRPDTQSSHPLQTIFGGGYVPEQHGDEAHRYLPLSENCEFAMNFDDVLTALRQMLSLR
jgi:hypothetical protein